MKGQGIGRVYKATWVDSLPSTADVDDGPNYRTVEWDCRHRRECNCVDTAEWFAKFHSQKGPKPGWYQIRVFMIRKTRIQPPGRELIDHRDLLLIDHWECGDQMQLAIGAEQ